jgi:hypothetical protein
MQAVSSHSPIARVWIRDNMDLVFIINSLLSWPAPVQVDDALFCISSSNVRS